MSEKSPEEQLNEIADEKLAFATELATARVTAAARTSALKTMGGLGTVLAVLAALGFWAWLPRLVVDATSEKISDKSLAVIADRIAQKQTLLKATVREVPIGTIVAYHGDPNALEPVDRKTPEGEKRRVLLEGWLPCDGTGIPAAQEYADLRQLLGKNTTPDLRGMFLRGHKTDVTKSIGVPQGDSIKTHQHQYVQSIFSHKGLRGAQVVASHRPGGRPAQGETFIGNMHDVQPSETIEADKVAETRPVNVAVNWIIKAK